MVKQVLIVSFFIVVSSIKAGDEEEKRSIHSTANQTENCELKMPGLPLNKGSMTNLLSISPDDSIKNSQEVKDLLKRASISSCSSASDDELPSQSKKLDGKGDLRISNRRNAVTSQSSILKKWKSRTLSACTGDFDYQSNKITSVAVGLRASSTDFKNSSDDSEVFSQSPKRSQSDLGQSLGRDFFKPIKHRSDSFSE